jgi:hypothetical protein
MITNDEARILANASHAAHDDNPTLDGYSTVENL